MEETTKPELPTNPSKVRGVKLPVEIVKLHDLKMEDGSPVFVRCERVNAVTIMDKLQMLPGLSPKALEESKKMSDEQKVRMIVRYAPILIELGTSFDDEDGSEVRPAFWFVENTDERSIPGRLLSVVDMALMFDALSRINGYGGPAVDSVRFPRGERTGVADGAPHLGHREGEQEAAASSVGNARTVHNGEDCGRPNGDDVCSGGQGRGTAEFEDDRSGDSSRDDVAS